MAGDPSAWATKAATALTPVELGFTGSAGPGWHATRDATALDAAHEQGRWEREGEIVGWMLTEATPMGSVVPMVVVARMVDEIKRGAGRKETT